MKSKSRRSPTARQPKATPVTLKAKDVRWICPPLEPSSRRPKMTSLLGQERPLSALRTGIELFAPGYNVFLSGLLGSGRTRVVRHMLEELTPPYRERPDRVYLNNFQDPTKPRLLTLPRGRGEAFREATVELVFAIRDSLRTALNSRRHKASRKLVVNVAEERHRRLMRAIERLARAGDCTLVEMQVDGQQVAEVLPMSQGEVRSIEEFEALVRTGVVEEASAERVLAVREDLLERLEEVGMRSQRLFRRTDADLREMDARLARSTIAPLLAEFGRGWPEPVVREQLVAIGDAVIADLGRWLEEDESNGDGHDPMRPHAPRQLDPQFVEFRVLVLSSDGPARCPVIVEGNPTYNNLIGTIEPVREGEPWHLGRIHTGSLLEADGGFLILRAADVLSEPGVWPQLKRALKGRQVEIREYDPSAGTTAGSLQPEAIPIDVKVVLIGEPGFYEHLASEDPQFLQLFKLHAEFDSTVPNDAKARRRYADFLGWLAEGENLGELAPESAAAIAEFGARQSGRRDRLTTRFGELADLAREASFVAGGRTIEREHVQRALELRAERCGLFREHLDREFRDGYLLLRTSGSAIGQVNAMTVLETDTMSFGKPVRITASTGAASDGKSDLLNIEREAELSGPLHDKGVLILQGYLLDQFGGDEPISLQATICFEQLYSGLDGDSASCAELFALLSSLAKLPLAQGIAVTGSMNQKGDVQPVGGVNEKVEGFFRSCRNTRLTKRQGVIMPAANARDLMLDLEVVAAVEAGRFHVYPIRTVLEGLEILTGKSAELILTRVQKTLDAYRDLRRPAR